MNKQWKGFLFGFLSALLIIGFTFSAFAAYQKQATLVYDKIKIKLDGNIITPRDAK